MTEEAVVRPLDHIPATTEYREIDAGEGGPWSVVAVYQPIAPAQAREVFLPVRYDALRPLGFFYAALLPDFRDGDVLRLQYLPGRSGKSARPEVATEDARRLLDFIDRDRS
jgi:hypothetical protein